MTPASTPDRRQLRHFSLIMAGGIAVLFILLPWWRGRGVSLWPSIVAGGFVFVGIIMPAALAPVFKYWMKLGAVLGWINSRIILSVVYYGLVLPFGLVARLSGKDPMQRKFDRQLPSYRKTSQRAEREQLEKIF